MKDVSESVKKPTLPGAVSAGSEPSPDGISIKYRRLFEDAPDGILLVDSRTFAIDDLNRTFETLFGCRRADLLGKKPWEISSLKNFVADEGALKKLTGTKGTPVISEVFFQDGKVGEMDVFCGVSDAGGRQIIQCRFRDVTKCQRLVEQKMDAELQYRMVFESGPIGVAIADSELRYVRVNRRFCEMLGRSEKELLGKTYRDVTHADDLVAQDAGMKRLTSGEIGSLDLEKRYITPAGKNVWASVRISVIRDESQKIKFFQAIIEDITERKRVEQELRESEAKFSAAFYASLNLMAITRMSDGKILEVNEGYVRMLGYSREESLGKSTSELNIWARPGDRNVFVAKLRASGQIGDFETVLRRKDGSLVTVIDSAKVFKMLDEDCVLSVAHDITDRKLMEDALRAAKTDFQLLAENSLDMIARHGPDGAILYASPASRSLLGREPQEMVGLGAKELVHPDEMENAMKTMAVFATRDDARPLQLRLRRKDGSYIWSEVLGRPIRDPDTGAPMGFQTTTRDISDRKRLEEAAGRLRLAVDRSDEAIFMTDHDGVINFLNPRFTAMYGWKPEEVIGKSTPRILKGGSRSKDDYERFWQRILAGQTVSDQITNRSKDGRLVTVESSVMPIVDPNGNVIGFLATQRDVTDRMNAEATLAESEKRYRTYIENQQDILYSLDTAGILNYVSPHISRYGLRAEDMIGKRFSDFVHQDDQEKIRKHFMDVMLDGKSMPMQARFFDFSKNIVWLEVATKRQADEHGKPIGGIGIARDVTDRKRAESALADVEKHYRDFIENAPDAAYEIDLEGRVVFIGPRIGSHKLPIVSGDKTVQFIDLIVPEDRKRVTEMLNSQIESADGKRQAAEFRIVLPDGGKLWVEGMSSLRKDDGGKPVSIMGVLRDISERKQAEQQVREVEQIRSRFMQIVSHQLRTPLNSIRWNLETLLSDEVGRLSDAQREFIRLIYDAEIEVMRRISQMLLALDIQEKRVVLNRESSSLETLWTSVMSSVSHRAAMKEIDFRYQPPVEPLPPLMIDTEKIREAMSVLALNSLEYTPKKGHVMASIAKVGDRVRFELKDTGIGIPEIEQSRLFQRFVRASNASIVRQDASGLGLFIARNFIEAHGGQIGLKSKEGEGSVFWFELPLA